MFRKTMFKPAILTLAITLGLAARTALPLRRKPRY